MTPEEERRGAAIHEAGHAVVAWALGLNVGRVAIGINGDPSAGAAEIEEKRSMSLIDRIALCAAGGIAQDLLKAPTNDLSELADMAKINVLMDGRTERVAKGLREIGYDKAHELLDRHQDKVIRLADALATRSTVPGPEIAALLGSSPPDKRAVRKGGKGRVSTASTPVGTITLTVPSPLEAIVQLYDKKQEPFDEFKIGGELTAARNALIKPSENENVGAWAEVLAFGLATGRHENPWNSYFGPMGSGIDGQGKTFYFPDIAGTVPETVDHWAARARSLKHPFLKSRYADLAWEMSGLIGKRKRDPEDARIAVDAYLDAIPRMAEVHEHVLFAIRALDLAVLIGDTERTNRTRVTFMELHRGLMKNGAGMWWFAVDRLLEDKKAGVTDEERAELVADLESIATKGSTTGDPAKFNPHDTKDAAERLIPYYRRLKKFDDIKRLHQAVGAAFEHFASNADPMLAAALLQTATDAYSRAGLKDERDRTRISMQQKIGAAGENLQSFEHKIEITKDDMERFLDLVIVDDLVTSLVRLTREFLLKRAGLDQQVEKTLKEAPIMAHITQMVMADNRVTAKIGSVEDDAFGRVFLEAKLAFQFLAPWLAQAILRLREKHDVAPEHFVGWANRHGLFDDMSLLLEGVAAWERGDQVKAAHVLIPQIERALRKVADSIDVPITKAHPTIPGTSVAIGMGEILYNNKVAEALGPDTTFHFQALYADPRGINLRNEIAHGLLDAGQFDWHLGNLIIHSILILGLWKEFGPKRSGETQEAAKT